jgi:hypothetical protein
MLLSGTVKELLRDGAFPRWQQRWKDRKAIIAWEKTRRSVLSPQAFKTQLIRETVQCCGTGVLVETGASWDHTVAASLGTFDTIY